MHLETDWHKVSYSARENKVEYPSRKFIEREHVQGTCVYRGDYLRLVILS